MRPGGQGQAAAVHSRVTLRGQTPKTGVDADGGESVESPEVRASLLEHRQNRLSPRL